MFTTSNVRSFFGKVLSRRCLLAERAESKFKKRDQAAENSPNERTKRLQRSRKFDKRPFERSKAAVWIRTFRKGLWPSSETGRPHRRLKWEKIFCCRDDRDLNRGSWSLACNVRPPDQSWNKCFFKFGPIPAPFSSFSHSNINCNHINWKSIDGMPGIGTRGRRMVGAEETTELWRPPIETNVSFFFCCH